jgi:hypothetical protein
MGPVQKTLLSMERDIPAALMLGSWVERRKVWIVDVLNSSSLSAFSSQLLLLASAIKIACFHKVWLSSSNKCSRHVSVPKSLVPEVLWIGYPPEPNSEEVYKQWEQKVLTESKLRLSSLAIQTQILHACLKWSDIKVHADCRIITIHNILVLYIKMVCFGE